MRKLKRRTKIRFLMFHHMEVVDYIMEEQKQVDCWVLPFLLRNKNSRIRFLFVQ